MSVNQNVPTCVAAGTNNGCRPNAAIGTTANIRRSASPTYHGLHVSFVQRPIAWSSLRVTYTLSKSMNDVGEAFFSSPIDPTDIMRDWGRSDDDQRHRLVINGTVNTPMTPATTAWEHLSHGFQLSGMLQVLLGAAVQHHLGRDEPAGHRPDGRSPTAQRRPPTSTCGSVDVHPAERGHRQRFPRAEPPA